MDKRFVLAFSLIAVIVVLTPGCCSPIDDILTPKPCPTITVTYKPTPTPRPTPTPTPTVVPSIIQQHESGDFRVIFSTYDFEVCRFNRSEYGQKEFFSLVYINNKGSSVAKNVYVIVHIEDANTGMIVYSGERLIGDIGIGEQTAYVYETDWHESSSPIYVKISLEWGENREYFKRDIFKHSFTYYRAE